MRKEARELDGQPGLKGKLIMQGIVTHPVRNVKEGFEMDCALAPQAEKIWGNKIWGKTEMDEPRSTVAYKSPLEQAYDEQWTLRRKYQDEKDKVKALTDELAVRDAREMHNDKMLLQASKFIDSLHADKASLKAENADLKAKFAELQAENAELKKRGGGQDA